MTKLHIGSCYSPGREALQVLLRSDGSLEIVANDDGAVVGDEVLFARHLLTVDDPGQAFNLGSLLLRAGALTK